jgi:hypothetical protein
MSGSEHVFRIHPAIGFARVGNSEEFYLGPETMAGLPSGENKPETGGLPIKAGTESEAITSRDLRDKNGALKRQAARFRVYAYRAREGEEQYPHGGGEEIRIGSTIGGKKVTDVVWTVHVANKKANTYVLAEEPPTAGVVAYEDGHLPPLRNPDEGPDPNNAARVRKLTIDPGPRAIRGTDRGPLGFDRATVATYATAAGEIERLPSYPKSFPQDSFTELFCPDGDVDTLGQLRTDGDGRLLVVAAYGRACAWYRDGEPYPLDDDVNNDGWFDDTADGPVNAVLVFDDGSVAEVHGAWVVSTDPAYAPQIMNAVTLWDDVYDTWIRNLRLQPKIFDRRFDKSYEPFFGGFVGGRYEGQIWPIFRGAHLQRWATNLPEIAIQAHAAVDGITAGDDPAETILGGLGFIRDPNDEEGYFTGAPLMPLALGDSNQPFLSLTLTQYFFLTQWNGKCYRREGGPRLGPGEYLDKAALFNCLGGRFSPGIDMTFIVRLPGLWDLDWCNSGAGPFRIHQKRLDYQEAQASQPFLSEGWVPLHTPPRVGLEPGDTSKFMAIPWHTDYNSCATHQTSPELPPESGRTTLYWSWPAQRPVVVYPADGLKDGELGPQLYSLRGPGTLSPDPAHQGRYRVRLEFVENWHKVGVVIQSTAIDGLEADPGYYLEVESQLADPEVEPWPINALPVEPAEEG